MFNKNNIKYILILCIGFFWCSSIYLTQEQYLSNFATVDFVNIVDLLFGSISMALGILLFAILLKYQKNIKLFYIVFMLLCPILMVIFFLTKNIYIMSITLCLTCFLGTAGFGAGYHFSLISKEVDLKYRGRVFAIGYGLGSIGTYLVILLPKTFYTSIYSLFLYIPMILLNLYLVLKRTNNINITNETKNINLNNNFLRLSIIVIAMSLLSALATDVIAIHTITVNGGYGATRVYYCLGLLIAGFLADKKNNVFEILTIVSFIFSLLTIILLNDNYSINLIAGLSYFFVGFFVLFRTMSFINLTDKNSNMIWASAFGLMYSRIMEGIMVLFEDKLINNYIILIIIMIILLSIVIILYFLVYYQNSNISSKDTLKSISIKYHLSSQEEKVLNLLVQDLSNQEIADKLFVSVNTIRNHVANIYRKTGMKKKNLKAYFYYGTV